MWDRVYGFMVGWLVVSHSCCHFRWQPKFHSVNQTFSRMPLVLFFFLISVSVGIGHMFILLNRAVPVALTSISCKCFIRDKSMKKIVKVNFVSVWYLWNWSHCQAGQQMPGGHAYVISGDFRLTFIHLHLVTIACLCAEDYPLFESRSDGLTKHKLLEAVVPEVLNYLFISTQIFREIPDCRKFSFSLSISGLILKSLCRLCAGIPSSSELSLRWR